MSEFLAVVPSQKIEETGELSWKFLITAGVSPDNLDRAFGFLGRNSKAPDYVNPFKLARGEPSAIGDDGVLRWNIHVFRPPHGLIMTNSVNSSEGEPGLPELLERMPDCNLLVPSTDIDPFSVVCAGAGHQLTIHRYEGTLSTS